MKSFRCANDDHVGCSGFVIFVDLPERTRTKHDCDCFCHDDDPSLD